MIFKNGHSTVVHNSTLKILISGLEIKPASPLHTACWLVGLVGVGGVHGGGGDIGQGLEFQTVVYVRL